MGETDRGPLSPSLESQKQSRRPGMCLQVPSVPFCSRLALDRSQPPLTAENLSILFPARPGTPF